MFYIYNKKTLLFTRVNWVTSGLKVIGGLILIFFIIGLSVKPNIKNNYTEEEVLVINYNYNKFENDKLINKIKELNFKYPHIVYAQSILETSEFKSKMFLENHNLFGMKEAFKRINLAKGTQNEHAYYNDWIESVYDYALYSATYLSSFKTEEEYFNYLSINYAEDKTYVLKLKELISKNNIKKMFE